MDMEGTDHTEKQKSFNKCYAKRRLRLQDPSTSTSVLQSEVCNIASTSTATASSMPQTHDNNAAAALDFKQSSGDSTRHTTAKTKIKNLRVSLQIQRLRIHGLSRILMSLSKECERINQENKSIEENIVRTFGENAL